MGKCYLLVKQWSHIWFLFLVYLYRLRIKTFSGTNETVFLNRRFFSILEHSYWLMGGEISIGCLYRYTNRKVPKTPTFQKAVSFVQEKLLIDHR